MLSFCLAVPVAAAGSRALGSAGLALEAQPSQAVPQPSSGLQGEQAPDIDFFGYFGYGKSPEAEQLFEEKGMKGIEDVVFSQDLGPIKNAYLKPRISFLTGRGTRVYVSGTKAANCPDGGNSCKDKEKFFLVLTTERNESYFVRAMEILNWGLFMSGSKTVSVDGENYVVKVYANASDPANSKLEITGPRGAALSSSLKAVGDAVADKGVDVKLGKSYKLAYGNEIVQGPQGAKFTSRMLLLLMPFPVVDASSYYIFNASDIRPSGVSFPSFEKGFGFRLEGTKFSIYRL